MHPAPVPASRAVLILALLAAPGLCQATAEKALEQLTFEQSLGQLNFGLFPRTGLATWAEDGVHLRVGNQVVDAITGEKAAPAPGAATEADGQLGPRVSGRRGKAGAGGEVPMPKNVEGAREIALSPDGKSTAFVQGHDLKVYDPAAEAIWAVTNDGGENVFNGILDWVYQEEVYGRGTFKAHWWSPDSSYLAFLRLDEKDVKTFAVVDDIPAPSLDVDKTVKLELEKYPKAGDPNPYAKLLFARRADKQVLPVDLAGYDADVLIVRVGWFPEAAKVGAKALIQLQNRIQTWLDLCAVDPQTGKLTRLFREESDCWVNVLEEPRWLADGTFLWLSERTATSTSTATPRTASSCTR
jgi:hypothetical protein